MIRRLAILLLILTPFALLAVQWADPATEERESRFYRIETISIPKEINLEVGGMAFMPDGRLMICTRHGDVWALKDNQWKRFASGLDEPMGLCAISDDELVAAQRSELTRLLDTDHDGAADRFETITTTWNYSGHDYEWTFGPVRDRDGNFFGALPCWFFSTREFEKLPYMGWELLPPRGYTPKTNTAWRGWCFKVTPKGEFIPWASGFRSPNGLVLDQNGELFIMDNQGEYLGADVLWHVKQNSFYGHPTALFWGTNSTQNPFNVPLEELDRRREQPAVIFPYRLMGQSASEPVFDTTAGKFGPFAGQLFAGDQSHSTEMRATLEKVGGEFQGACYPFRRGFKSGNNRVVFAKDGSLWIGETARGWGSVGGAWFALERLVWTGEVPFEILKMELTTNGFDLTFTKPVNPKTASDPHAYSFHRYFYKTQREYFASQSDLAAVKVTELKISRDGKKVSLTLPELMIGRVYEVNLEGVKSADGEEVVHPTAYYTLNKLREK